MADKNTDETIPEANEAEIERRVDAMMDPKSLDPEPRKKQLAGAPALGGVSKSGDNADDSAEAILAPLETRRGEVSVHEAPAEEAEKDDKATDAVVDDIVAHEGDELLAAQDAEVGKAFVGGPVTFTDRVRQFLGSWWQYKPARYGTLAVLVLLLGTAGVVPTSRYMVLSTVGVRSSASMTILDNTTGMPLKNVTVALGQATAKTNADGVARLSGLRLGAQQLTVQRLGFAPVAKTVTVGLGSNPLGEFGLKAVGAQYIFTVTDYVSGKPVGSAEAASGEANAQADDKGRIVLTVGKIESPKLEVTLTAGDYRSETVTVAADTKAQTPVVMVSKQKEVFISRQSGKYDVYKIDIDGKNRQVLLAGTGIERPEMTLVSHATDNMAALVSSRENKRNQDGYLLDTLTLINVDTGAVLSLDASEQIKVVDWIGDTLVYVKTKAGTSAGNAERYQLMSYDYQSTKRLQLAAANYFADIVSAKGALYYATGNYYQAGKSEFVRINPDTTGKQTLLNSQVWSIIRSNYNDLYLAGAYEGNVQNWYAYRIGDSSAKKLSQAPADANSSRFYLDAPDGKRALWTEVRDGKGVLLAYDAASRKDTVLATQSGLVSPLRWLDSRTVIYRTVTSQETADYVISLDGGSPRKIVDVTNAAGLGRWNYGY